jgi:poly-gamma-glutamate capsule biosynthesis protein CapA/YwtB (metallophosphatase superfamily)
MKEVRFKNQDLKSFLVIVILLVSYVSLKSQDTDTSRLSLVFAGDIMGHEEQINGAWDPAIKGYNYEPTFRYVKSYIEQADIAIANLEVTLAGSPFKGYPQFSSPDALALAAHDAGFDVFIQANNHALDRDKAGFARTLLMLDSIGMIHTGTFANSTDRDLNYPLIIEKNNVRVALLNYTYSTNGIAISKPFIINRIDTAQIRRDLEKAKLANPDFTIVTMHWGEEYQRFENQEQQKLAAFILGHGADAIIGSHPHVIQPIKLYPASDSGTQKIVVYSQGNLVSNQRAQYKDGGILTELKLIRTGNKTMVEDFSYLPTWVYREDLPEKSTFYIVPVSFYENNSAIFNFKDHDRYKISLFATDTREHLKNIKESDYYKVTSP